MSPHDVAVTISSARAIAEGLRFRNLDASLDDTLAGWDHEQPRQLKDPNRGREQAPLTEWRATQR